MSTKGGWLGGGGIYCLPVYVVASAVTVSKSLPSVRCKTSFSLLACKSGSSWLQRSSFAAYLSMVVFLSSMSRCKSFID
ncbi:hypothetical protein BX666DRAFT_1899419 [Dichotomocladium elegans]|nr:hypothetical protein BX666DRAFT_1899419 [Dichotomocladium elegans]